MADAVIRETRTGGGQTSPGAEGLSQSEGLGRTQAKNVLLGVLRIACSFLLKTSQFQLWNKSESSRMGLVAKWCF